MNLQAAIAKAQEGALVEVPFGVHRVNLVLTRSITLVGARGAVLDGGGRAPVVRVEGAGLRVALSNLTLQRGRAAAGGGVCFLAGARLDLTDCALLDNRAPGYGGGALYAREGTLTLLRCRLERNLGRQGGGLLLDRTADAELTCCLLAQNAAGQGGGLRLREASQARLVGCTVADNRVKGPLAAGSCLSLSGSASRCPTLDLMNCIVADADEGRLALHLGRFPGQVSLCRSMLPPALRGVPGDAGDNVFGNPGFAGIGEHPYRLAPRSAAAGAGSASAYRRVDSDLLGRPRVHAQAADAGAYAAG